MAIDLAALMSAWHRSDQAFHAQLASPALLPCATAYCADAFGHVPDAHHVREVLLGSLSAAQAYDLIEAHFAGHGRQCLRWSASPEQESGPIGEHLTSMHWMVASRTIWGRMDWGEHAAFTQKSELPQGVRILAARAMRKAFRATFDGAAADAERNADRAAAAAHRLNDSNYDAFVATCDGAACGRVALLEVGDICRIEDLHVQPEMRRRGLGRALLRHVLQLAFRLRPRVVVTAHAAPDGDASRPLLESHGFSRAGDVAEWLRVRG